MPDTTMRKKLMAIYRALYRAYGPQNWWPADTPFEVMVGAVLTRRGRTWKRPSPTSNGSGC